MPALKNYPILKYQTITCAKSVSHAARIVYSNVYIDQTRDRLLKAKLDVEINAIPGRVNKVGPDTRRYHANSS